ncbi:MAG: hypothetical protein IJ737_05460 [Ruminococcus sp.]|nr:hypothetical protein [Ruminococcus sp.]
MDPNILILIFVVVITLVALLIRFVISSAVNKGARALENSVGRAMNARNGPEVIALRDLYPQLAAAVLARGGAAVQPAAPPVPGAVQRAAEPLNWTCGCGAVNEGGARFCNMCGSKRPEAAPTPNLVQPAYQPANRPAGIGSLYQPVEPYNDPYSARYPAKKPSSGKAALVIMDIVILMGIAINALILFIDIVLVNRDVSGETPVLVLLISSFLTLIPYVLVLKIKKHIIGAAAEGLWFIVSVIFLIFTINERGEWFEGAEALLFYACVAAAAFAVAAIIINKTGLSVLAAILTLPASGYLAYSTSDNILNGYDNNIVLVFGNIFGIMFAMIFLGVYEKKQKALKAYEQSFAAEQPGQIPGQMM